MEKSKLTLIVDGNWLLMSRWSVMNGRFQDDEEMCREIQSMMVKSINVVLRTFPSIDNIIFVSDDLQSTYLTRNLLSKCLPSDKICSV